MRLVLIDLVPALLSWEGRDAFGEADVAPDADPTLQTLYDHYRLEAVADSTIPGPVLRDLLATFGLADWFERVGSTAVFGPTLTPRVVRKLAAAAGVTPDRVATVTARDTVADRLRREGLAVVLTGGPEEFADVPEAMWRLEGRRP
ncbi:MAG: hypothetical protein R3290_07025 [Acidimicrobiia bacterium]|nr:hypothetical protein [Acidimicrobiia bacterium]